LTIALAVIVVVLLLRQPLALHSLSTIPKWLKSTSRNQQLLLLKHMTDSISALQCTLSPATHTTQQHQTAHLPAPSQPCQLPSKQNCATHSHRFLQFGNRRRNCPTREILISHHSGHTLPPVSCSESSKSCISSFRATAVRDYYCSMSLRLMPL
jgi:hypothetical protein